MRKIAPILLLALLSFNWFGYNILISFFQNEATKQLEIQLDNDNYSPDQLFTIKIPVTYLAYYTNSRFFERVNGQIEIRGVMYNYVKKRLYNDSVELLCIPNIAVMKLQTEKNDLAKSVGDNQQLEQTKKSDNHSKIAKSLSLDNFTILDLFQMNDLLKPGFRKALYFSSFNSFAYCAEIENPPESHSLI